MNKKIIIITTSSILLIIMTLGVIHLYKDYKVRTAAKIVEQSTKEVEVFSDITLKDIIKNINGKLLENKKIDTTKIGMQEIEFEYINDDNIKVPYTIYLNIVDTTPPIISMDNNYSVTVSTTTKKELEHSFFCGDNYDNNPKCSLSGNFDLDKAGTYEATFTGIDFSNNKTSKTFNLIVKEKSSTQSDNNSTYEESYTDYNDIIKKYKTDKTKIGIDVSHWQGNIDYKKLKKSGVEFVYIRVGRGDGIGADYIIDDKFERNIKGFNKVGIPVGIYFYSYANSRKDAIKEAKWVLSKIKKYKVDLEIVFDWENWDSYQDFNLSFYNLTETAKAFTTTVEEKGYKGMLYSSKNYLENIWYQYDTNIWLAHYTNKTNYEGNYKVWQLCSDGKVDGISSLVDIDIMYK